MCELECHSSHPGLQKQTIRCWQCKTADCTPQQKGPADLTQEHLTQPPPKQVKSVQRFLLSPWTDLAISGPSGHLLRRSVDRNENQRQRPLSHLPSGPEFDSSVGWSAALTICPFLPLLLSDLDVHALTLSRVSIRSDFVTEV